MLGIGFSEMVLIAGIALVVIGPEKFPDFAKLVIRTVRDLRGYVDDVKTDLTKELTPIKKEMDQLSKIDPEKYIDSLTHGDDDEGSEPGNPSLNEEDRKVMAGTEIDEYGDDPYGWESSDDNQYGVDKGAYPEETVGYGSGAEGEGAGEGEAVDAEPEAELQNPDEADEAEAEAKVADTPVAEPEPTTGAQDADSPELLLPEDDRIELSEPNEPDVWTGR